MPLFIPFLLGGLSIIAGAAGIGACLEARDKREQAKKIVEDAERRLLAKKVELDVEREVVYNRLITLGKLKKNIFEQKGRKLLEIIGNVKTSYIQRSYEIESFLNRELPEIRKEIIDVSVIDMSMDLAKSTALAYVGACGIYGAVMTFGTASTGTAIASLSGAAATKATLAWFGGGSLASGGLGVAGGMWVLGGLVVGPALAMFGISRYVKAEEALTEAQRFQAEVNKEIQKMNITKVILNGIMENIEEVTNILEELSKRFDTLEKKYYDIVKSNNEKEIQDIIHKMILVFKAIKFVVNEPILNEEGRPVFGIREKILAKVDLENIRKF